MADVNIVERYIKMKLKITDEELDESASKSIRNVIEKLHTNIENPISKEELSELQEILDGEPNEVAK